MAAIRTVNGKTENSRTSQSDDLVITNPSPPLEVPEAAFGVAGSALDGILALNGVGTSGTGRTKTVAAAHLRRLASCTSTVGLPGGCTHANPKRTAHPFRAIHAVACHWALPFGVPCRIAHCASRSASR